MVYLLHFDRPISAGHTAQHYIGKAKNLRERIEQHRRGQGARLCEVAKERGIGFKLVRTWEGGRREERALKNKKCGPRLCPYCAAERVTVAGAKPLAF